MTLLALFCKNLATEKATIKATGGKIKSFAYLS